MMEDNIKMDLRETEWESVVDSSGSRKRTVAVSCEYGNEPSGSIKYGEFLD
jgi:hypothetical protein